MDAQTLRQFEAQCLQEEPPACQTMCPLHLEARSLAGFMAEGKIKEGRKILDRHLPLSGLLAYLCEGPCRTHCRRQELDQGLDMPRLERFCASNSQAARLMPLPPTGKKSAVFGGGLSSLCAAWDLAKKGHSITLFHQGSLGGRLLNPPPGLPDKALPEALEALRKLKVRFEELAAYQPETLAAARQNFPTLYLGLDDPALAPEKLGLAADDLKADQLTLASALPNVFVCPAGIDPRYQFILEAAAGRKAALSIDRILGGSAPEAYREGEAVYPSRLYTNLEGQTVKEPVVPADPLKPSLEEVQSEAARCLQCQCLECVKKCVYLKRYKGYPKKYAREIYNNISTAFGIRHANTMVNSCAECGLCKQVCPGGADMGAFIALARREMVETKHMPVSAHEFALEDQEFSNSPDIAFLRHQPGQSESRWLFFPGCQLPASLPEETEALYGHLARHLEGGVAFGLGCCGAPARWSGRPELTGETAAAFRKGWEDIGRPKLITACASCGLFFQAELPEVPRLSLWEVLDSLPLPEKTLNTERLALHDPCAARLDQAAQKSVRSLLKKIGQETEQLPLDGPTTRCCGYGGLASAANPGLGEQFALARAEDSGGSMLAYCVMCRDRLKNVGRDSLHLLNLLFPRLSAAEAAARPSPGISERQETRRRFRLNFLKKLWGEELPEDSAMKEIIIHIPEDLAPCLESRRILRRDIQGVLQEALAHGPSFVHPENGRFLASHRPRQVTFWVEYRERADGSFDILDAYCHRMLVPGVSGAGASSPASREGFDERGGRR